MSWLINESKKNYIKTAVLIGIPVILQNLVSSLINTLNVFMVGQLGEVSITTSSVSNQWFTLFFLLVNGLNAAGSMFISQYWGQRDKKQIHAFMGILFYGNTILALFFTLSSVLKPAKVMGLYSMDPAVIEAGITYTRIIGISFLICALSSILITALRSIGETKIPMFASVISLICSLLGNYLLIFGKYGFPKLGLQGSAIATVTARCMEFLIVFVFLLVKKPAVYGSLKDYFVFPLHMVKKYIRYGFWIIFGEVAYSVGHNFYNIAYKYTGTESQAALQIIQTIQGIALVFCSGFGIAAAVMLGTMLGKNQFEKAKECSKTLMVFCVILSVFISAIVILSGPHLLDFFQISSNTKKYAELMILIMAVSIPIRMLVYLIICGILRSGGDSISCFTANLVGVWIVGLPAVCLSAMYFKLPIHVVYAMATLEEVGKLIICLPRVVRFRWIRNITD